MKLFHVSSLVILCLCWSVLIQTVRAQEAAAPSAPAPVHGWPRTYTYGGNTVVMYQPQIDAWKDHEKIRFRAAVVVTPTDSTQPQYGVVAVQADTMVDEHDRTVLMTNFATAVWAT